MTTPNPFAAPEPGGAQPEGSTPAAPAPGYGQAAYGQPPQGYGAPGHGYGPPPYGAPRPTNGMAIASLVLGILWLGWIGSVLAVVFGFVAKSQIARSGEAGSGLATAGLVLGWIGVGTFVLLFVLPFLFAVLVAGF